MDINKVRMDMITAICAVLLQLVVGMMAGTVQGSDAQGYNVTCPDHCDCRIMPDEMSILCADSPETTEMIDLCSSWPSAGRLSVSGVGLSCLNVSCVPYITYIDGSNTPACPPDPTLNLTKLSVRNITDLHQSSLFPASGLWTVHQLDLSGNGIEDVAGLCGRDLSDVHGLDLSSNNITSLPGAHLRCLQTLAALDLSYNSLVDANLTLPKHLQYLNLSHNAISAIAPGAFSSLSELLELDLSFNHIEMMESATFACGLSNLRWLTLAGNQLQSLKTAAFTGLGGLRHVNLSYNQLDEVSGEPFIHIPHKECGTQGLHLANETYPLDNSSAWINLDTIDLGYNNITEVHRSLFKSAISNCNSILLNHNNLRHFPRYGLEMLPRLERLRLDHNRLYWLDVGTFTSRTLRHINLAHNRLKKIISMTFLFLPDIEVVDLSHNELNFIYKVAFYKSCKHNQRFKVDLSHNYLTEDVTWAIVTSFRHLVATECVVDLVVQNNILRGILGTSRHLYERHLLLMDVEYFTVWDHVTLDIRDNPLNCDCNMMSDAALLAETRKLFDGNMTNTHHLDFWPGARCVHPRDKVNQTVDQVMETSLCASLLQCPYECDCYYNNVTVVNCTKRNLVTIPYELPPGEKKLYLSENYIMELEDGSYLDNVTYLDLSSNALINIEPEVFYRFALPVTILLHSNVLSQIPSTISQIENSSYITLKGNPISCDCENWWFVDWMLNHTDIIMDYANMTCDNERHIEELDKALVMSACSKQTVYEGRSVSVLYVALGVALALGFLALIVVTLMIQSRRRILPVLMNRLSWYRLNLEERGSSKDEVLLWYSPLDEDWVSANLFDLLRQNLPLHNLCPYHQCLIQQDDQQEDQLVDSESPETQDCLQKSFNNAKSVVVILSNNFIATEWSAFDEWHTQHRLDFIQDALQMQLFFVAIEATKLSEHSEICELIRGHSYHEVTEPLWREALVDGLSYVLTTDGTDVELTHEELVDPGLPHGDNDWTDDESLGLREKY